MGAEDARRVYAMFTGHESAAFEDGLFRGRAEERAAIVAWLRGIDCDYGPESWQDGWDWYPPAVAAAIERGEYLTRPDRAKEKP